MNIEPLRANFPSVMPSVSRHTLLTTLAISLLGVAQLSAQAQDTPNRRLSFSGMVDADFSSDFGNFDAVSHYTGLEADLITQLTFSPILNAEVRTTMRDGHVPQHGTGNTWAPLRYDGAQVNWKPGEKVILMAGDLIAGSGYFQYARYKRVAAVVGEHSIRGVGFRHGNIVVQTGVATDSIGEMGDWSVYAKWSRSINPRMSWTPSFRYTAGIPGANPFELGITFNGDFNDELILRAYVAMNYWNPDTDPGSLFLVEPRYVYGDYFVSATLMRSEKGEVPAPNVTRLTGTSVGVEDVLVSVEPGITLDQIYAAALALEYRNPRLSQLKDESIWMIPSFYVYPAPRAEWRTWTSMELPLKGSFVGAPTFALGSEIAFTF